MTETGWRATARVMAALARRSVRQTFRQPRLLAPVLVFPTLFLAINTGGAGRAVEIPEFPEVNGFLDFQLAAAMTQATLLAGLTGGISFALDIENGFIDRLAAAPIPRSVLVTGRLAATAAMGAIAAVWFLAIGLVFGARIEAGVPGVLLIIVLVALTTAAWGGLGAALALRSGRASVVQGLFPIVFVILFLSSAFFPRDLLLEPAGTIADFNPLSFIAEGIRDPVISDLSLDPLLKCLAGIVVVAVVSGGLAARALTVRLRAA